MKHILILLVLGLLMLHSEGQNRFVVFNRYIGENKTYSVGDKLIYSIQGDTNNARKGTIVKITSDSLFLTLESICFKDLHTIYKEERWKKRLIYFSVLNAALLIPTLTTSNDALANLFFIPWFCTNLYFATTGLHYMLTSKEQFHLPNDSEIRVVY